MVWISRYWKGTFIRFAFVFSLILMELSSCSLGPGGRHSTTLDDGVRVRQMLRDQAHRIQLVIAKDSAWLSDRLQPGDQSAFEESSGSFCSKSLE